MAPTTRRRLLEKQDHDQANHRRTQDTIPEDNPDDSPLTASNSDPTNDDVPPKTKYPTLCIPKPEPPPAPSPPDHAWDTG